MEDKELTQILTDNEISELVALVSSIMEAMRSKLELTLNAKRRKSTILEIGWSNPNLQNEQDPSTAAPSNPKVEELEVEVDKKLQEARPHAIKSFSEWQEATLHRILEAIHKHTGGNRVASNHVEIVDSAPNTTEQDALKHWYPSFDTRLASMLDTHTASLTLHSLLLLAISLEIYDPRSRTLLLYVCSSLRVPVSVLLRQESGTARLLLASVDSKQQQEATLAPTSQMSADSYVQQRADATQTSRRWKVGLATVGGAVLIGVTGGLAAPLVAAGLGTLLGGIGLGGTVAAGYLGAMAASAPLVGGLFGAYGGKMSGEMMKRYADEVEDFAFLPLHPKLESKLRVTVCISGWLTQDDQVKSPWMTFNDSANVYALRWEMKALLELGSAIETLVRQYAIGYIKSEIIKRTVLASLWSALWPLGLLKFARIVDNPFNVAKNRSEKTGLILADAIIHRAQGKRPISLIGFSLGARVIYSCLLSLAERKAFGLVETVVLMGAPVPSATETWALMRAVVSGRLVNAYASEDWVLGFLYRTSAIQLGVAGLQPIEGVEGVENFDVGDVIDGHLSYAYSTQAIVTRILDADLAQNITLNV